MATEEGIIIPITLDTDSIEGDVQKATQKISKGQIANGVLRGIGKMTKGAIAGINKLSDLAQQTAQSSDRIDKMSQKIGISAQSFQEWDYVMNLCGGSIEGMQMGMKTLRNVMTEAQNGNKTYMATLAELSEATGIVIDFSASEEEQMDAVIAALQGMDDQTMKAQLATDLFGRSATDLLPLLNSTAEETQAMKDEAHALGLVLSDDAVKSGAAFNDAITKAKSSIEKATQAIVSEALPSLTNLAEAFAACASGSEDGAKQLEEALSGAITDIIQVAADRAPEILQLGVNLITTILKGLATALPEVAKAASDIIPTLCNSLAELAPELISAGFLVVAELVKGIINNLPAIAKAAGSLVTALLKELAELGTRMLEAGKNIVDGLVNGIKENINKPIEAVKELGNSIVGGFKKVLGIHSPSKVFMALGTYIDQGLEGGINNGKGQVITATEALAEGIAGVFVNIDDEGKQIGAAFVAGVDEGLDGAEDVLEDEADNIEALISALKENALDILKDGLANLIDGFSDLGEALASGENGWTAFAKSGLQAVSSLLQSLGSLMASQAVAALVTNPALAMTLAAGSAAAYLGAGVVKGYANSFESGGIVRGSSTTGDNIPVFANAGELILNKAQQKTLAAQLAGSNRSATVVNVNFNGQTFGDQRTISTYVYEGIRAAQAAGELA